MRCFIALSLPASAREAIAKAAEGLRAAWPGLTWVAPENYHLTLAFLAEQGPAGLACAKTALSVIAAEAAPLVLPRGIGTFPARGPWQTLVVQLEAAGRGKPDALARIHEKLNRRLASEAEKLGLAPLNADWSEDPHRPARPFHAHITLARRGSGHGGEIEILDKDLIEAAMGRLREEMGAGGWPLEACILYKSELRPKGAVHIELERVSLFRP